MKNTASTLYTPKHRFIVSTSKGFDYKDLSLEPNKEYILSVTRIVRYGVDDFQVSMKIIEGEGEGEKYKGYGFTIPFNVFEKCFVEVGEY